MLFQEINDEEFAAPKFIDQIKLFNESLDAFKIKATCVFHRQVRNVSIYDLRLTPGTRIASLQRYATELALSLHAKGMLNFQPVLETGMVRVEVVEEEHSKIDLLQELKTKKIPNALLPVYLGSSIDGQDMWTDLAKNPHLLIAGTTGSGKSVLLHNILANTLLFSNAKVWIIDTKALEFEIYRKYYHQVSIATTYSDACDTLELLIDEMELRYYNMKTENRTTCPYAPIVLMIDEFADLIMQDENEKLHNLLCRLAQKSRAANIFCVVATQRPSVNVISGIIKANLPARIACKVSSKTESRVILDQNGAENLIGKGDAIISNYEYNYVRFQAAFISSKQLFQSGAKREHFQFEQAA